MTRYVILLGVVQISFAAVGCTSQASVQAERYYVATYSEVFEKVPVECKKCGMELKNSDPQAGLMTLNCYRAAEVLTASIINMVAGDEVLVKVQRVSPTVSKVWIDSKARGQIGPDLGRTDRNVKALAETLDKVWAQVPKEEETGEKRPGAASQPSSASRPSSSPGQIPQ